MCNFQKWKNYQAWNVEVNDFPASGTTQKQLFFLVRYGVLAPSSHNSQPWRFAIKENSIEIFLAEDRLTPVADPSQRFAHIAIGGAAENILIAGDYFGFEMKTVYFPRGEASPIAEITCTKVKHGAAPSPDHLIFSIPERLSNRYPYTMDPLPVSFLEKILSFRPTLSEPRGESKGSGEISQLHDYEIPRLPSRLPASRRVARGPLGMTTQDEKLRIDFVDDAAPRKQLAVIIADAREAEFDEPAFRREIALWKRTNWTRSTLGIPGFTMGFPTLLSFIAPTAIKYVNVAKQTRQKDINIFIEHTPAVAIISSRDDTREQWVASGQLFERIALEATREGLATNIMAAATGYKDFYKCIQLLLRTAFRPQFLFRIGRPEKPMFHSPRLLAEQVTTFA